MPSFLYLALRRIFELLVLLGRSGESRLPPANGKGVGVEAYIRRNWDGRANGNSPELFWGVRASGEQEGDGAKVYEFADEARQLYTLGQQVSR